MNERRKPYPFDRIEPKWQTIWDERRAFHAPNPGEENFDPAKPKYYVLDMFPYPSGAGLHVGHPEGYTATDIIARYKRLRGFNVLHPMGWDAFGLPAEQYAIKTGQHPAITTRENVAKFKTQLKRIGFSYDWEREVNTTDPTYYKWTQWIFLQIYNSWFNPETKKAEPISTYRGNDPDNVRLAYVAEVPVNWCQELGTVLANEEVIDGKSEVGGFPVVRRPMRQWMLRITAFADRLLDELEGLDWPDSIKALQRNWIGRSEGAEIDFPVAAVYDRRNGDSADQSAVIDRRYSIRVFTTRPDTLYGATYMVLAPENPLVDQITTEEHRGSISQYRTTIAAKSDLERTDLAKEKTGAFTGAFAINPANSERIPIWIADYVLMGYGTGAIMGVPAHDERDLEFARKFDLPIIPVVQAPGKSPEESIGYLEVGIAINSPLLNGLSRVEATAKIIEWLEQTGNGRRDIRYKLRDWLFPASVIGANHFPSSGATESMKPCRNQNCRSNRPPSKISNRPAPANRHWRRRKIGSVIQKTPCVRRTRCRSGPARVGITCGFAIRRTTCGSSAKNRSAIGWEVSVSSNSPGGNGRSACANSKLKPSEHIKTRRVRYIFGGNARTSEKNRNGYWTTGARLS